MVPPGPSLARVTRVEVQSELPEGLSGFAVDSLAGPLARLSNQGRRPSLWTWRRHLAHRSGWRNQRVSGLPLAVPARRHPEEALLVAARTTSSNEQRFGVPSGVSRESGSPDTRWLRHPLRWPSGASRSTSWAPLRLVGRANGPAG